MWDTSAKEVQWSRKACEKLLWLLNVLKQQPGKITFISHFTCHKYYTSNLDNDTVIEVDIFMLNLAYALRGKYNRTILMSVVCIHNSHIHASKEIFNVWLHNDLYILVFQFEYNDLTVN